MNLKTYQEQSQRTCPDLGSEATNLAHMVLGICSEYSELVIAQQESDLVNVGEEISDKNWYLANYCNFRGYSLEQLYQDKDDILHDMKFFNDYTANVKKYFFYLADLQDLVKKNLAYGKEINRVKEESTLKCIVYCLSLLFPPDFNLEKSLQNNIDKLKIRFPDKFDQEKALNRNLVAERAELEK